jgi:hypothetical protein
MCVRLRRYFRGEGIHIEEGMLRYLDCTIINQDFFSPEFWESLSGKETTPSSCLKTLGEYEVGFLHAEVKEVIKRIDSLAMVIPWMSDRQLKCSHMVLW